MLACANCLRHFPQSSACAPLLAMKQKPPAESGTVAVAMAHGATPFLCNVVVAPDGTNEAIKHSQPRDSKKTVCTSRQLHTI